VVTLSEHARNNRRPVAGARRPVRRMTVSIPTATRCKNPISCTGAMISSFLRQDHCRGPISAAAAQRTELFFHFESCRCGSRRSSLCFDLHRKLALGHAFARWGSLLCRWTFFAFAVIKESWAVSARRLVSPLAGLRGIYFRALRPYSFRLSPHSHFAPRLVAGSGRTGEPGGRAGEATGGGATRTRQSKRLTGTIPVASRFFS